MVNWWKPAADRAVAEWNRKARATAALPGTDGGSRFYMQRMQAAIALEIELMEETVARVSENAARCTRSEEIADPDAIARETLDPILNKTREIIRAQPNTVAARGGNTLMIEGLVAQNLREAEEAHRVRVADLANALRQQKAALELGERREADERNERAASQSSKHVIEQADNFIRSSLPQEQSRIRRIWSFASSNQLVAGVLATLLAAALIALLQKVM